MGLLPLGAFGRDSNGAKLALLALSPVRVASEGADAEPHSGRVSVGPGPPDLGIQVGTCSGVHALCLGVQGTSEPD